MHSTVLPIQGSSGARETMSRSAGEHGQINVSGRGGSTAWMKTFGDVRGRPEHVWFEFVQVTRSMSPSYSYRVRGAACRRRRRETRRDRGARPRKVATYAVKLAGHRLCFLLAAGEFRRARADFHACADSFNGQGREASETASLPLQEKAANVHVVSRRGTKRRFFHFYIF